MSLNPKDKEEAIRKWREARSKAAEKYQAKVEANGGRTPIKSANRERKAKLHDRNFGRKRNWIVTLPCCVPAPAPAHDGPIHGAHVRSRGAGGTWKDLVPMCAWHHRQQHLLGIETFEMMYDIVLSELARRYERDWQDKRS